MADGKSIHDPAFVRRVYRGIYRIRRVEEEIIRLYPTDKIKSPVHLSIGQESVSVGACEALRPDDYVSATYRGHAAYLAKGGDLNGMMAELYGKETGCARGKAGSMHLVDMNVGMLGTSAIVATGIPQGVGYAWALRHQGKDSIVLNFFGDGAVDEGVYHESINFAALKQLPIIFLMENNRYAIYSHVDDRHAGEGYCKRTESYGVPTYHVADGDPFEVYDIVSDVAAKMRTGDHGPVFIEVETYRWRDHVGPGVDLYHTQRTEEELQEWVDKDQLKRVGAMIDDAERMAIEQEVEREIEAAIQFAEDSEFPQEQELFDHVYHA